MAAAPVIIELDDVGQMFACPTAKRLTAFAVTVDGVGEAGLQNGLLGLLWRFLDAQRERMEIQDRISVMHQAASRNVAVA